MIRLGLPLAVLLTAAPLSAAADGNGLAVGETARLHASFETEARYDTLAALGGVGAAANPVFNPGDLITHLRPGLRLDAPGSQLTFTGGARLDYAYFTGIGGPTRDLSFLGAFADANLDIGHGGPATFTIADHFSRSDVTSNAALGLGTITDANGLEGKLNLRPGGGALEFNLGYLFGLEAYELHSPGNVGCPATQPSCDGTKYGGFGSLTHRGLVDVRYRFLPKTALIVEGVWALRTYQSQAQNIQTAPLRVSGGLLGLITEKVRVLLKAGYENSFAQSGANFGGFVGQGEIGWEPRETTKFAAGLLRSIEPVSDTYGWYQDLRVYASASVLLAGRVLVTAGGNGDQLAFANRGRVDLQVQGNGTVEYQFNRFLKAGTGVVLTLRDSSEGGVFTYQRAEIFGRITATY